MIMLLRPLGRASISCMIVRYAAKTVGRVSISCMIVTYDRNEILCIPPSLPQSNTPLPGLANSTTVMLVYVLGR